MPRLRSGAATNPGRVRSDNEDTYVAEDMVFAVADGMGGHQAGEVASALAASIMRDRLGQGAPSEDAALSAVMEANSAIHGAARANAAQSGMGTTLTALAVLTEGSEADETSGRFVLLNVGDSRTYRFRQGKLQRVTVDHSYVQELVATGHITTEEARTHPRRNIVTRALGIEPSVRADMWTLDIVRGDRFVLCSDGLVDEVADDEIVGLVASVEDPQQLADQLVEIANRHGGRDNVTVVVVDVLEGADPPDPTDEIAFDPAWADGNQGAAAIWAHEPPTTDANGAAIPMPMPVDTGVDADPVTVADATAVPTVPPPAMPLPPADMPLSQDATIIETTATDTDDTEVSVGASAAAVDAETTPAAHAETEVNAVADYSPRLPSRDTTAPATDTAPPAKVKRQRPKRRFGAGFFLFVFLLAAIITVTFTLIAVHARSGYYVGFDGDTVVVFKGQEDSVLWFHPTIEARSVKTRDQLEPNLVRTIENKLPFDSAEEAAAFIDEQVIPTTSTTVPESTTTTSTEPPQQTLPGDSSPTSIAGP